MHTTQPYDDSMNMDDPFAAYAAEHDPDYASAWSAAPLKPRRRKVHMSRRDEVAHLTDEAQGLEAGFETTYQPARYEAIWLYSSLRAFYDQALITDILSQVKGGKEASVYRCVGHPTTGTQFLAAKVYRPRQFRNLRNDKIYREGRQVLDINGRPVKADDARAMRALEKGTAFGAQLAHTSWLMHEFNTLARLHDAGGSVPKPISSAENSLLMEYVGDENLPASTLHEVRLDSDEARRLFTDVLDNIELMLSMGIVHGDLSAYNILYWQGEIVLIDFPQVVSSLGNAHAQTIFSRDVHRVCDYFVHQGVESDPQQIVDSLWNRYAYRNPLDDLAELSRWEAEHEEEEHSEADTE